jgi:hypothetical protein
MNQKPNDLIPYTADRFGKTYHVCLTPALYEEWKNYPTCLGLLIHRGLKLLQQPSATYEIHLKERVVVKNQVSVIEDWEGRIIFMKPQELDVPLMKGGKPPCTTS